MGDKQIPGVPNIVQKILFDAENEVIKVVWPNDSSDILLESDDEVLQDAPGDDMEEDASDDADKSVCEELVGKT